MHAYRRLLCPSLILIIMAVLFSCPQAWADTWHVDQTNAAGPWDGSEEHPFQTVNAAIAAAAAGDTVMVAAGIYDARPGDPDYPRMVTVNKSLNLIGAGPDNTKIVGERPAIYCIGSDSNILISGFEATSVNGGIFLSGINSFDVQNCVTSGCGSSGIWITGGTGRILNCTSSNNAEHGIYMRDARSSVRIHNSIVAHNSMWGIRDQHSYCSISSPCSAEVTDYNCIFGNGSGATSNLTTVGLNTIYVDPLFIDANTGNYRLDPASPCRDAGRIVSAELDPDGTRSDMGAYGGPTAARFWPYPIGGPTVTELSVTPSAVPVGATIDVEATGEIR